MAFDSDVLLDRLQALIGDESPARWLVAYSGGIDSAVLLHALVFADTGIPVLAIHVDHGLHPDSGHWATHAKRFANELGVEFISMMVVVQNKTKLGLEAAAREARYRALSAVVEADDWVLSGHHENDQAETLLLNLMRGSGPAGLAGIGACFPFERGVIARPMLGVSGDDIEAYARKHDVDWIDDPSNNDSSFDRNFVRRDVMPLLNSRWPAVTSRLRQSAALAGEAGVLLSELADVDIATCGHANRLSLVEMNELSPARQRNLLRRAAQLCGLPSPPATRLYQTIDELIPARGDAQPIVTWRGGEFRRYRDRLYVLSPLDAEPSDPDGLLGTEGSPVILGKRLGSVRLVSAGMAGVDPVVAEQGLAIRFRAGGEALRIAERGATRKLKNLLQEAQVLPWMRNRIPLLFAADQLVAVGDLWISAGHRSNDGLSVEWSNKPAII